MKNRISTYITVFLIIPIIVFICVLCTFMSGFLLTQKSETLTLSAQNLSGYITSTYQSQLTGIVSTVQNEKVIDYILNPEDENLREEARTAFLGSFNIYNYAVESSLLDRNGNILITNKEEASDIEENHEITESVVTKKEKFTELGYQDNTPLLIIGYPIKYNEEIIGIYKRISPLTYVEFYARNVNQNDENVILQGSQGNSILFRSGVQEDLDNIFIRKNEESEFTIIYELEEILKTDSVVNGTVNYNIDNTNYVGGFSVIEDMNWICLVSQPRFLIYYDLNFFQLVVIVFTLILLFLIAYFARNYIYKYLSPFLTLNQKIKDLNDGVYSTRFENDQPGFVGDLGENLNTVAEQLEQDHIYKLELEKQLTNILNTDQITGLYNNRALYNIIDNKFDSDENQAIIMFNTGIYDQINNTFGNNVSNRLLELVTQTIQNQNNEHAHVARFSRDIFCVFIDQVEDPLLLTEEIHQLALKLNAINKIDDLQIQMNPHISLVFNNEHLLGRSDWLRIGVETLREAEKENIRFKIFDFTDMEELQKEKPELFDNIFSIHNEPIQGFTRSQKKTD